MGPEILRAKLIEIDLQAESDKAGVQFVIDFIEANEPEVREAFGIGEDQSPEIDEQMYEEISTAFKWIQDEILKPYGVTTYNIAPDKIDEQRHPYKLLGLADFTPAFRNANEAEQDKPFPHLFLPTVKGIGLVDQYRLIIGLPSLKEEKELQRQART